MKPILVDTGPIVSLLDAADAQHAFVREAWARLPPGRPLITTGAVITECLFLLQGCREGPEQLVEFIRDVRLRVEDAFQISLLSAAVERMAKYADLPMDFADASLVLLAERFGTEDIVTLDERGFRAYRIGRTRAFRLLLQSRG